MFDTFIPFRVESRVRQFFTCINQFWPVEAQEQSLHKISTQKASKRQQICQVCSIVELKADDANRKRASDEVDEDGEGENCFEIFSDLNQSVVQFHNFSKFVLDVFIGEKF